MTERRRSAAEVYEGVRYSGSKFFDELSLYERQMWERVAGLLADEKVKVHHLMKHVDEVKDALDLVGDESEPIGEGVRKLVAQLAEAKAAPSLPTPDAEDLKQLRFVAEVLDGLPSWAAGEGGEHFSGFDVRAWADRLEAERAHDTLIEQVAETIYTADRARGIHPADQEWDLSKMDHADYMDEARALVAAFNITPKEQ